MANGFLSERAAWNAAINRLTLARRARSQSGIPLLDLTESNPTQAGLTYDPQFLRDTLARHASAAYSPEPRGLRSAREAIAAHWTGGEAIDPDDIFLTASTSEAYSFLFKLLTNPGDSVLTATPCYPLLEHIGALESVTIDTLPMRLRSGSRRWELDSGALDAAMHERTRAIVVVHPNNPTGSYLTTLEQQTILNQASQRTAALISDEVFFDFSLRIAPDRAGPAAQLGEGLTFTLGGLSKSAALPHWKLGWIVVGGSGDAKKAAIDGLELICDTFLSVATPVQLALPEILAAAPAMRAAITTRMHANLASARKAYATNAAIELIEPEGGWSLVIRVPRVVEDEQLAVELVEQAGVLVQPGYFFDFETDGFLVVSLLTTEEVFAEGIVKAAEFLGTRF